MRRHNPVLLLLPQAPKAGAPPLNHPYAWWRGKGGRGDYHPCSVDFFLSQVHQTYEPRPWSWIPFRSVAPTEPTPVAELQKRVGNVAGVTENWEIDLATIRSGKPSLAWQTYSQLVQSLPALECRVYARYIAPAQQTGEDIASAKALAGDDSWRPVAILQYWYLYLYNDATNTHEGDWEMVSVELDDETQEPTQVAYSGHQGGARRAWAGVTRMAQAPVVYVGRGSHAAYLDHMPRGYRTAKLEFEKGLPRWLQDPLNIFLATTSRFLFFGGIRDYTCARYDEDDQNKGEVVRPVPDFFEPSASPPQALSDPARRATLSKDARWWWMTLDCRWGSSHSRVREYIAPLPPWRQLNKWDTPVTWLRSQRLA